MLAFNLVTMAAHLHEYRVHVIPEIICHFLQFVHQSCNISLSSSPLYFKLLTESGQDWSPLPVIRLEDVLCSSSGLGLGVFVQLLLEVVRGLSQQTPPAVHLRDPRDVLLSNSLSNIFCKQRNMKLSSTTDHQMSVISSR